MKFPKSSRLLKKGHFIRVLKAKNRLIGDLVIMDYCFGIQNNPRLGLTVSCRYGSSPKRNRLKRLIREAFRHMQHELKSNLEINVSPKKDAPMADFASVRKDLLTLKNI